MSASGQHEHASRSHHESLHHFPRILRQTPSGFRLTSEQSGCSVGTTLGKAEVGTIDGIGVSKIPATGVAGSFVGVSVTGAMEGVVRSGEVRGGLVSFAVVGGAVREAGLGVTEPVGVGGRFGLAVCLVAGGTSAVGGSVMLGMT